MMVACKFLMLLSMFCSSHYVSEMVGISCSPPNVSSCVAVLSSWAKNIPFLRGGTIKKEYGCPWNQLIASVTY